MVYFNKTQSAPISLAIEKRKGINGNYRCWDVLELLKKDFFDKCYICEKQYIDGINVEHFEPHRDLDIDKKFDWNNLFWSCAHCNGIKSDTHIDLLNCTKISDCVDQKIKYDLDPFAFPSYHKVIIEPLTTEQKTLNTVILLQKVYKGVSSDGTTVTDMRKLQAGAIREKLFNDICDFECILKRYFMTDLPAEQEILKMRIINELKNSSQFTAFKRYVIRNNRHYFSEFSMHIMD